MRPDVRFLSQPQSFWAHVRTLSQVLGYTNRKTKSIHEHKLPAILRGMDKAGLSTKHLVSSEGRQSELASLLVQYFEYRARVLNEDVRPLLMTADDAKAEYLTLKNALQPTCPLPLNKQKGAKKAPAYLTCIVNMLVEQHAAGLPCDYDPHELTTVTQSNVPVRTLARRVDGAFPSTVNPTAIWEIKEYYYTKTFGSRVADGVYETLLDGMELKELRASEGIAVLHYLIVDDSFTWWSCGRSYLCRLIDMMHMGYVDEVLFGKEVLTRLPDLVPSWRARAERQTLPQTLA